MALFDMVVAGSPRPYVLVSKMGGVTKNKGDFKTILSALNASANLFGNWEILERVNGELKTIKSGRSSL